jgi:hypothetical protein
LLLIRDLVLEAWHPTFKMFLSLFDLGGFRLYLFPGQGVSWWCHYFFSNIRTLQEYYTDQISTKSCGMALNQKGKHFFLWKTSIWLSRSSPANCCPLTTLTTSILAITY